MQNIYALGILLVLVIAGIVLIVMISKRTKSDSGPNDKPGVQPDKKPVVQPNNKPDVKPADKPVVQPNKKPGVQPNQQVSDWTLPRKQTVLNSWIEKLNGELGVSDAIPEIAECIVDKLSKSGWTFDEYKALAVVDWNSTIPSDIMTLVKNCCMVKNISPANIQNFLMPFDDGTPATVNCPTIKIYTDYIKENENKYKNVKCPKYSCLSDCSNAVWTYQDLTKYADIDAGHEYCCSEACMTYKWPGNPKC